MDFRDTLHVVGLTCDGEIALLRTLTADQTIVLPAVTVTGVGDGRDFVAVNRLLALLGYEARELVTMSRYGIPNEAGGHSSILMAPLLARRATRPSSVPGLAVHEIPAAGAAGWLRERRALGAYVDPTVWVGLRLFERLFASWARERLRASLRVLRRRRFAGTASASGVSGGAGPPRERAGGA